MNKLLPTFLILSGTVTSLQAAGDGVSPSPYELTEIFGLPVTNTILTTWVISILFILAVRLFVGKPKMIPAKGQAVVESLIDGLRGLLEPIVGKKAFPMTFPLLIGLFLFIVIHNWSGLIPGVGVFGHVDDAGHFSYWMRPANSDLNATLGMALVAMIGWLVISLRVAGLKFFAWELFGNKADKKETPLAVYLMLFPIFIGVGLIEVVSIMFRPVSLSFRLFGNVFGGENLLTSMTGIAPYLIPVPFYLYEVLVGVVQALIFTLLVAIYVGLMTNHEEDHAH
ncbi:MULTISPECIES: F0F1 ATP synthase subunit A [unclassified Lentimonas]|uniref:F0F1 ATP synthase subunit A n=1 Tax=unclassified Lentimonas TaxID=2630993 RepID=UPI0013253EB3|nr:MULTISPECIES: F0F1 ATP synthase subunit A [unclassified Lentimonas]CAA6690381.1 ATP synthase F0 sector subunit a (EC [Lentimonas sp. CC10]CAA6693078.1 ATP synthase F0 sector subunit a (EC [Lentimonas sp. CC19]CAA7069015.1 ATP synthase F0 sector subunit a (EC [Lentimonas sp. CC11]